MVWEGDGQGKGSRRRGRGREKGSGICSPPLTAYFADFSACDRSLYVIAQHLHLCCSFSALF